MCAARQYRHDRRKVLVLGEAHNAIQLAAWQALQLFGYVSKSVGVVSRIAYGQRLARSDLPAAVELRVGCGGGQSLAERAARYRKRRLLVEHVGRCAYRDDVASLVVAHKVEVELVEMSVAQTLHAEMAAVLVEALDVVASEQLLGIYQRRARLGGGLPEYLVVALVALAQQQRNALLGYAGLLRGDLLDRIAQERRVLHADVGHDAQYGHYDVGGVEAAAQTCLDDRNFDVALGEVVECQRRRHLEERQIELLHLRLMLVDEVDHLLLGDELVVDTDALAEVHQMRRGVESRAVARLREYRCEHVRHRPLAVGAGHVDREVVALRIAQMTAELGYAFEPRLIGIAAHLLERGHRREQKFESLRVVHIVVLKRFHCTR